MIVVSNTSPLTNLQGEHIMVTGTASSSSNRYGDENQLNIDDCVGCTFFYTGEWNGALSWSLKRRPPSKEEGGLYVWGTSEVPAS